ncbi:MAG: type IX secretion system membrane protein PorP/SprF [bacterium]|nr:type IX secretion system membrane protein PorP/SprF [bacterium]
MKSNYLLILFAVGFSFIGWSQQLAGYSNFLMNDYYFNPAIAGSEETHEANISYRNQWVGFNGAPTLIMGNFMGSYKNEGKVGYGASVISERKGITGNTTVYVNYAYHFKLSENLKLGLGVQPGYMQHRVRLYDAIIADAGDDVLTGTIYSANAIDVNAGFNLHSPKFFLMGSFQRLLGRQIQFTSYNTNLDFHYNTIAGYNFNWKNEKKKDNQIQPSIMVRYVRPLPVQYTAMLRYTFDDKYWAGLLYRSDDAVGIAAGMRIKERVNVGYSFDYTLSKLSNYQVGSHEVMLSFVLTKRKQSLDDEDDELNKSILEEIQKDIDERENEKK